MGVITWTDPQKDAMQAKNCSVAVSAAAGSGKTAVLTRRIIRRICEDNADISRMLIVTFTREAARELSERIGDLLSDEFAAHPENKHLETQLLLLPSAKIGTIDGFCLDLIREYFADTGISGFGVISGDAEQLLKAEMTDDLISDYFDGFVTGKGKIENFGEFADTFGEPSGDSSLCEIMQTLYDFYYGSFSDPSAAICGDSDVGTEVKRQCRAVLSHYCRMFELALAEIDRTEGAQGWHDGFEGDLSFCRDILSKIDGGISLDELKEDLENYGSVKKSLGRVKSDDKTPELLYYYDLRNKFAKTINEQLISGFFAYEKTDAEFFSEKTKENQKKLSIFLDELDRRVTAEKKRKKMLGFSDMERLALALLCDAETGEPTPAAREISERFDEIYIDEYQDTSEIQDMIFSSVAKANNLFTVGDVKQSIYAFRGSDVSLFENQLAGREKYDREKYAEKVKIYLSENFRSCSQILDMANGVFEALMNEDGVVHYGEDEKLRAGRKDIAGYLPEMNIIFGDGKKDPNAEAEYVARRISEMISNRRIKPEDIAVLARTKSTLQRVEKALKKAGVPCESKDDSEFLSSPEVLSATALLGTVDNPMRDVYLAGTLKSPLYGVTLGELIKVRKSQKNGSLFSALTEYSEKTDFSKGKKFIADNEKFREYAKLFPCGELVRRIFSETRLVSVMQRGKSAAEKEKVRANLRRFYDLAREYGKRGGGLYEFMNFMKNISDGSNNAKPDMPQSLSDKECVSLMTIHASKGLEFRVCFLCGTEKAFNRKDLMKNVSLCRKMPAAMYILKDGKKYPTAEKKAADGICEDVLTGEALRLLYVALTRAKEQLIITAGAKSEEDARAKYDYNDPSGECALDMKIYSSYARRKSTNYLDLLCAALSTCPALCRQSFISAEDPGSCTSVPCGDAGETCGEAAACEDDTLRAEADEFARERLGFVYPYSALTGVPSKLSVSHLYPDVLDKNDDGVLDISDEDTAMPDKPMFLREDKDGADAAEKGTAMHTFMQFFDFDSVERVGVAGEIKRMTESRLIFGSDAELLDIKKLESFFASDLASEMKNAVKIYREKRFIIYYPAERFSEDAAMQTALVGEKLLVQGVIDCAFINKSGELILVDYKTDGFDGATDENHVKNILKKRHRRQLEYYRYACEQMFSARVAHTYIYSFALDGTVEI